MHDAGAADRVRFGPFELDVRSGELYKGPTRLKVPDQSIEILRALLEQPGQLITRDELRHRLWPNNTFVDFEHGVNAAVRRLREALGDAADTPRFIETLPRRGYRFVGPVDDTVNLPSALPQGHAVPPALPDSHSRPSGLWKRRGSWLIAALVVLLGTLLLVVSKRWALTESPIRSLAVLPLELVGDPKQGYVGDGLTEALGAALAQLQSVDVKSAASAKQFRNTNKSAREIGRELGVDGLIEGSVTAQSGRILIAVSLIDARTDHRVWTRTYDRSVSNVFAMLGDVTSDIASEVSVTVTSEERARLTRQASVKPDAFDAYLRGMSFRRRWQEGGCSKAVTDLELAVAYDPTLADAHAALAWCYAFPDRTGLPATLVGPKATQEATAALALNPDLSLARVVLGLVKHRIDYDWVGAEREFKLALDLNPKDPDALFAFGEFLYASGKSGEGIARLRSGVLADPSNADRNAGLGFALLHVRQYDASIHQLDNTLALNRDWTTARRLLADAYEAKGDRDRAIAEYLVWLEHVLVTSQAPAAVAQLKNTYDKSGWYAFWQQELKLADSERRRPGTLWQPTYARFCGPFHMALRHARLSKRDLALSYLQQAYEQRHHQMVFLKIVPLFDTLHDDPAFQAIARRVGIP